jgi:microcystin-dependent protein
MDAFMALIASFGFNYAPYGWALCNGQILNISTNSALFALLGTMYGGNGQTTFGLPDLRGRAMIGMGQGPGLSNYYQGLQGVGGTETCNTLVAHTHAATIANASATVKAYSGTGTATAPSSRSNINVLSGSTVNLYGSTAPDTVMNVGGGAVTGAVTVNPAGVGTSFSLMQPYLPMNFSISTTGIFPSRN